MTPAIPTFSSTVYYYVLRLYVPILLLTHSASPDRSPNRSRYVYIGTIAKANAMAIPVIRNVGCGHARQRTSNARLRNAEPTGTKAHAWTPTL